MSWDYDVEFKKLEKYLKCEKEKSGITFLISQKKGWYGICHKRQIGKANISRRNANAKDET